MRRHADDEDPRAATGCALVIGWGVGAMMVLVYFGWIGIVGCPT